MVTKAKISKMVLPHSLPWILKKLSILIELCLWLINQCFKPQVLKLLTYDQINVYIFGGKQSKRVTRLKVLHFPKHTKTVFPTNTPFSSNCPFLKQEECTILLCKKSITSECLWIFFRLCNNNFLTDQTKFNNYHLDSIITLKINL